VGVGDGERLQEAEHQAWGTEEGPTGCSRHKGAWVRLGQKSCDGERLKSSSVMDVLLLCGHLWLPGRGLATGSSTSTARMTGKPQQLGAAPTET